MSCGHTEPSRSQVTDLGCSRLQPGTTSTINSDVKDLDEAVLRPGRQRFFKEFDLLTPEDSAALAAHLGIKLAESRSYSLAELYHHQDVQERDRIEREDRPIGFGALSR